MDEIRIFSMHSTYPAHLIFLDLIVLMTLLERKNYEIPHMWVCSAYWYLMSPS